MSSKNSTHEEANIAAGATTTSEQHQQQQQPTLPSFGEDIDDNSEFDVSEAKENKTKSSDNSTPVSNVNSPNHPTTRSESTLNATLTDSGRVKRKCVIESEKRKLYMTDIDSPPYFPISEDIPQKFPRIKGRRGRPPKSATMAAAASHNINSRYAVGMRGPNEVNYPSYYYQSSPSDGFSYTFSTALANVSCRLVMDGHFRNIVDHHKTLNFPHNIFSHDIIPSAVQQQKYPPAATNTLGRSNVQLSHMFNRPGPHIFRQANMPQMRAPLIPQAQQHIYHNMMPPNQPIPPQGLRPIPTNVPIAPNFADNSNMYRVGGPNVNNSNSNQRSATPTSNRLPQSGTHPSAGGSNNIQQSPAAPASQFPNQKMVNSSNTNEMTSQLTNSSSTTANRRVATPSGNSTSSNTTVTVENQPTSNAGGGSVWLPPQSSKPYQSAAAAPPSSSSYPITNNINNENNLRSNSPQTPQQNNPYVVMGVRDNSTAVSAAQHTDTYNQLSNPMDSTDQGIPPQKNPIVSSSSHSNVYHPEKDL